MWELIQYVSIIQACDNLEHVNIQVCEHSSMWILMHVSIQACQ